MWLFILFTVIFGAKSQMNNVCSTYEDYYTIKTSPNCWYDIAGDHNFTEIVTYYGYPVEEHKVITPDGYILSLFRIPNYRASLKKGPIFLQHGLLSTAANFIGKRRESLAFLLSDAGYDVWLGNYRGTEYSEGHLNLTVSDGQYWDYTLDELGLYDVPTMLNYITKETNQRIIYVGHSLGTTMGYIYSSVYPQAARQTVKLFVSLAPAASLVNMVSPLRLAAPFAEQIYSIVNYLGIIRLTSQSEPLRLIVKMFCLESPVMMQLCIRAANLFYGPKGQIDPSSVPVFFNQFPAGTSLKASRHTAELVLDSFERYPDRINKFGPEIPYRYDISKIEVPVFIMYAVNDWATTKKDALALYRKLSSQAKPYGIHEVSVPNFNHVDFLFGKDAKSIVYDRLLNLFEQVNNHL